MSEQQQDVEERKGKFDGMAAVISGFFSEVGAEFGRITWPKGKELIESTVVVIILIVIISGVVLVFDKVIEWALKLVMGA
jgi:preprotein translocase SecE subunit